MYVSVLLVGNQRFLRSFLDPISDIVADPVEASFDLDDVLSLIQTIHPAVVILQATQVGSLALCDQIKQHSQLGWVYCIVIDDQSDPNYENILADRCQELTAHAQALAGGADAYLRLTSSLTRESVVAIAEYQLLKAQIEAGLRIVQFYDKLQQTNDLLSTMALADPLTELNNRRAMEWDLPRQIQNARTHLTALSIIMIDVDFFKSVNDNYGHQVGDRVLQLLSARLQNNLRIQDTLFRYGGEEFLIILSQTNLEEAQIVAKRLRTLVSEQPFNIDGTLALQITISLGVACLNSADDLKGETLVRRADHNLMLAKSSGRNRVFCAEL